MSIEEHTLKSTEYEGLVKKYESRLCIVKSMFVVLGKKPTSQELLGFLQFWDSMSVAVREIDPHKDGLGMTALQLTYFMSLFQQFQQSDSEWGKCLSGYNIAYRRNMPISEINESINSGTKFILIGNIYGNSSNKDLYSESNKDDSQITGHAIPITTFVKRSRKIVTPNVVIYSWLTSCGQPDIVKMELEKWTLIDDAYDVIALEPLSTLETKSE